MTSFNLSLGPLDRKDAAKAREWRNRWEIWQFCRQNDLISDVEQDAWFDRQAADPTIRMYRVELEIPGKKDVIGVCGFTSIDFFNRRAEFSLYLGPEWQRKGLGRRALSILLGHGFSNLGLNRIYGETFETNPAAKMFESLGFVKEGTRKEFYFKDGRFIDAHLYSIGPKEWTASLSQPSQSPSSSSPSSPELSPTSSSSASTRRRLKKLDPPQDPVDLPPEPSPAA